MWHYGDTIGFKSAIERFSEPNLTIIVLCNRSTLMLPRSAARIADVFLEAGR